MKLTNRRDWKKLTFYYFADTYINFNSLVTDLFKIYKTRIWMSAINPASFASPTLGLQAPSGIGPGAVGLGRGSGSANAERRSNPPQESQGGFPGGGASGRSFQPTFTQPFGGPDRPSVASSAYPSSGFSYSAYGGFSSAPRSGGVSYVPGVVHGMEYSSGFPQSSEFTPSIRARFPSPNTATSPHDPAVPNMTGQNEWVGAFQGLSLNSR